MNDTFQLNIQSPSMEELDTVTFDAEYGTGIRGETTITGYPTENGFMINNGIINRPEIIRARLGFGATELTGLLSTPLAAIQQNWTGYISSYVINFVKSGIGTIIANQIANTLKAALIQPSSRQGQIYIMLQILRLTGSTVNLVIHNVGTMNNFNIRTVELIRGERDDITIDISLQQQISKVGDTRTITTASGTVHLGQSSVKTKQVEI
ncbi:hypothetical protein P5E67_04970 [Vibrio parahaemolyticus]|nr:hypothetical protein [Vibrio parahaemolyticus]